MSVKKHNHTTDHAIPGDYQYVALRRGTPIQKQWHRNRHTLLRELSFFKKTDTVLDAGCGSGNVLFEFAPRVLEITGIDNSRDCVDFVNHKIKELSLKNVKAEYMNLLDLKLAKNKYDKIILTEVIEHFPETNAKKVLQQLFEILKPGGSLLITTPNYYSAWAVLEPMIDRFNLSPKLWGEQHFIQFNPKRLQSILESEGFVVQKKGTLNMVSPFTAVLSKKLADSTARFEIRHVPFGSLLYAVAAKPGSNGNKTSSRAK